MQDGRRKLAVEITRDETAIRLATPELTATVDRATLALEVASRRWGTRLGGFAPRARVNGRELAATRSVLDGDGEIRTQHGVATRLVVRAQADEGLDLILTLEAADDWPGVILELELGNRGEQGVRVEALDPIAWSRARGGVLTLPGDPGELRAWHMGFQSSSPAGWRRLGAAARAPRGRRARETLLGPYSGPPESAAPALCCDCASSLRSPGAAGLTLGFLTHERWLSHVRWVGAGGPPDEVVARNVTEGLELAARSTLRGERLWLGLDGPGEDGVAAWAERAGREGDAPVPARVGSVCTAREPLRERVERTLDELAPLAGLVETLAIGAGHEAAIGDWLRAGPGFPDGLAPLAERIRAAGFRAGLWLAPFLAARTSRLAREHPEWLLGAAQGRPRVAYVNRAWRERVFYALDPTHPELLEWLGQVFATLVGWGFDWLELDFLYAGTLVERRHDPGVSTSAAYRQAVRAIRTACGPDAFLLGARAPLGPSIGLFDALRVGPDSASVWRRGLRERLFGDAATGASEDGVRNALARASLHQRLWINDPGCLRLGARDSRLRPAEIETLAAVLAASGGLVRISEDLASMGVAGRTLLRRLLPPVGRSPDLGVARGEIPDQLSVPFPDGSVLLLRINLGSSPRRFEVDPAALGLEPPARVYDVLADRERGLRRGPFTTDPVPAHGSALLRLTPVARRPSVVGTSLHMAAGALETARLRVEHGVSQLRLRLPGRREGRVILSPTEGPPVSLHVSFADELGLEVEGGGGLEESVRMDDALDP